MNLPEALEFVFNDSSRITRRTWMNRSIYCSLVEGKLCITGVDTDGRPHPWTVSEQDWFSDDWEVCDA